MATTLSSSRIISIQIEDARKNRDNAALRNIATQVRNALGRKEIDHVTAFYLLEEIICSFVL